MNLLRGEGRAEAARPDAKGPDGAGPVRVHLSPRAAEGVRSHCSIRFPEEACGLLFCDTADGGPSNGGAGDTDRTVRIGASVPAPNGSSKDRRTSYAIPPEFLLRASSSRPDGSSLAGVYHSHPDGPSGPSPEDGVGAWPGLVYVIVPVRRQGVGRLRAFLLPPGADRLLELPLRADSATEGRKAIRPRGYGPS